MKMNSIFTLLFVLIASLSFTQGSISGTVTDGKTGETIPGVKILIESLQKGVYSDLDGNFKFSGLPVGTYELSFKYGSYNTKVVTGVIVKNNENTTLNVSLDAAVQDIQEVTVVVTVNKESNSNLLQLQKNNAGMVDGISSESIKRSPDRTTSDVLKRVSGASIQDNKFVIIRGLNDRYNTALINGLPLPSTEPDRRAFSFDIFPSSMLDNMLIYKTASPDLPGDFAGGVIVLNTKDIPEKNFVSFGVGGSYNTQSTFKEYQTYNGTKQDWIGWGESGRWMPGNMPSTEEYKAMISNISTRFEASKLLSNNWGINTNARMPLGQNYQMAFALTKKVFKNDLGIIGGVNYNYNRRFQDVQRADFDDNGNALFEYQDDTYRENVLWGGMLNFAYKLGDNNRLSFKNMYSTNSEDMVIIRNGTNYDADRIDYATAMQYTSNRILTSQLSGDHFLPKSKIRLKWGLNHSNTQTVVPDLKRMLYYKNRFEQGTISDSVFTAYVPFGSPTPDYAGRFFSEMNEKLYSTMAEVVIPYKLNKETSQFKFGYASSFKDRYFNARVFGYAINNAAQFNYDLLYLPQDEIFADTNMTMKGFRLGETTNPSDSYTAGSTLHAGYLMTDQKIGKIRAVYGLRVESFEQWLNSRTYGGDTIEIINPNLNWLPSLNLTYALNKKTNIRVAASRTVVRPDFRELAPFSFYDFNSSSAVVGNDTLKSTNITNLDLRFEWYPGNGQILSFTGFYKNFENAIENTVFFGGSGSRTYTLSQHRGCLRLWC
jgi:outer membrane receptor protein involved in Fe transport